MNRIVLWCVFACCCLVSTTTALAQEDVLRPNGRAGDDGSTHRRSSSKTPVAVGIDVGINYNIFSQNLSAAAQAFPFLKVLESGSGVSPFFNAYVDIGIHRSVGIQLKMGYDAKKISNEKINTENCPVYEPGNPFPIADTTATVNNEYTVSPAFVALAALVRVDITKNLIGTIGPVVHFANGKPLHKLTRTIQSPDSCYFNFGTPEQSHTSHTESEDPNTVSPRFGVEFGLGYKIPLTPSIDLVPKAGFQLFFSEAFDKSTLEGIAITSESRLHSAQFSIGLLFGL